MIARELGDRGSEGTTSWNLGILLASQHAYEQAVALMQQCVEYERELGHPDAEQDAARVEQVRRKAQALATLPEALQRTITPFNQEAFDAGWSALPEEEQTRLMPLLKILGIAPEDTGIA